MKSSAPLLSLDPSGSFQRTIISLKGRNLRTIQKWHQPGGRMTPEQASVREKFRLAKDAWNVLTDEQKQEYNLRAKLMPLTGYNLFIKEFQNPMDPLALKWTEGIAYRSMFQPTADISLVVPDSLLFAVHVPELSYAQSIIFSSLVQILNYLDMQYGDVLDSIDLNLLASCPSFSITGMSVLTSLNLSSLLNTNVAFSLGSCDILSSLSLPSFQSSGYFNITNCGISSIDLSALNTINNDFTIANCPLASIDLSALVSIAGQMQIANMPNLAEIILNPSINGLYFNFNNNPLTQDSQDSILAAIDAAGYSNGFLDIASAIPFTPSPAGYISKASLIAKGWTVNTN